MIHRGASPQGAVVLAAGRWSLVRLHQYAFPGWLVLAPDRHVTEFGQLDQQYCAEFAGLLARLDRAVRAEVDPVKVYMLALGDRIPHWHMMVAPVSAAAAATGITGGEVLYRYPEPPDRYRAGRAGARIAGTIRDMPAAPPA
jgi:diadenosine tetraphosphate (Ap4A) HIT family hydrolase